MKVLNNSIWYVLDVFCMASAKILYKSNLSNAITLNFRGNSYFYFRVIFATNARIKLKIGVEIIITNKKICSFFFKISVDSFCNNPFST